MNHHVALTKCYFCGGSNEILLATRYRTDRHGEMQPTTDVSKLHGQVVDKRPCPTCEDYMKQGILLISARPPETAGEEPYRTGGFWVVREEAAAHWFKDVDPTKRCAFIPNEVAVMIGLPNTDKLVP